MPIVASTVLPHSTSTSARGGLLPERARDDHVTAMVGRPRNRRSDSRPKMKSSGVLAENLARLRRVVLVVNAACGVDHRHGDQRDGRDLGSASSRPRGADIQGVSGVPPGRVAASGRTASLPSADLPRHFHSTVLNRARGEPPSTLLQRGARGQAISAVGLRRTDSSRKPLAVAWRLTVKTFGSLTSSSDSSQRCRESDPRFL